MNKLLLINGLVFMIGGGVGVLATRQFYKMKYEQLVKEEVESIYAVRNRGEAVSENTMDSSVIEFPSVQHADYEREVARYHETKHEEENEIRVETLEKDRETIPYLISEEEFLNLPETEFDKSTLYFYTHDETLVDDSDEVITTPFMITGQAPRDYFSKCSKDPQMSNVAYVRNEQMRTLYEIIGVEADYGQLTAEEEDYNLERD